MTTIDEIIAWANTLSPWQGDAVRRLLLAVDQELGAESYQEILLLAKAEFGLEALPSGLIPIPPAAGMFSGVPASNAAVKLLSINDVQNVNIIKPGQSQPFAENGITVIYGDNGSGKSGYSRILKLACQARDKDERIIPNIFLPIKGPTTAILKIKENGSERDIVWTQGANPDPILTNFSVFDGRCARVITDERNEITYLPYGCDVFPKLAELVLKIRAELESEITNPRLVEDSGIIAGTSSATFLHSLSATTKDLEIELATEWTQKDTEHIAKQVELARISEPSKATSEASRLHKFKDRINGAAAITGALSDACAGITNTAIERALLELKSAKEAHDIAAAERQTPENLAGVGITTQWEILYEAAKNYAEQVAYPGEEFPKTNEALCVLCQQPLSKEAIDRFARFKKYMTDVTSTVLANKRVALSSLRDKLERLSTLAGVEFESFCDNVAAYDTNSGESLRTFYSTIIARKATLLKLLTEDGDATKVVSLITWPSSPEAALREVANKIGQKANDITNAAKPAEYQNLTSEIASLNSRKALNARKSNLLTYIQQTRRNADLRRAINKIGPRDITLFGKSLIKKNLTPDFNTALKNELFLLGASRLPVSLKAAAGMGDTGHEMLITGAIAEDSMHVSQVLSEGETRVIAIAGFLAELHLASHTNAIVLDDPASSLDHVFTGKIAARLAKEGLQRQVIIFTHNIAFLMELEDACTNLALMHTPVAMEVHTVKRAGGFAGITSVGAPWHAMNVKERVEQLGKWLQICKPYFENDTVKYNECAAIIYGRLREAWESCIEEELLYRVICRYRNSIETRRLNKVAIEAADVHSIELNISKSSTWMIGHDKSKSLHEDRPSPQEILDDIKALREFSKMIIQRHSETEKNRKRALQPEIVAVGIPLPTELISEKTEI